MILLILGLALVVFGGVVLIYFPDRPGGEIEWAGVRVRSAAAGLPLIVLGMIAVVLAVANWQPSVATNGPAQVSDPEKTARELLRAWNDRDRDAALKVAEGIAVDKLFSASSLKVNTKELTCYPVGTGQRDCQVPHTKGILVFRLREIDKSWWVENVEY